MTLNIVIILKMRVKLVRKIDNIWKLKDDPMKDNIMNYINNIITECSDRIDEECEDDPAKDFYKLAQDDFVIYEWLIDTETYYDICHSKDDAEVGYVLSFDSG